MKKNTVRTGLIDQRSRATMRRRSRRRQTTQGSARAELDAWLDGQSWEGHEILEIDLDAYLRATAHIPQRPSERLRQLGVHLEAEASALAGLSGWEALERIFKLASRLDPDDHEVHISAGLSALALAEIAPEGAAQDQLFAASERRAHDAVTAAPDHARPHFALGYILYFRGRHEECLRSLARCLECGPDKATRAQASLYRAHVFHDQARWSEALASYEAVDRSVFVGGQAWRSDVLAEQRAECLFRVGRGEEARGEVVRILERYESEPHVAFAAMSSSFFALVEQASPELMERAEAAWASAAGGLV